MKSSILRLSVVFMFLLGTYTFHASALTWSIGVQDINIPNIGGGSTQRPTITSIVFNSRIYIAYTSTVGCSSTQQCEIMLAYTTAQQPDGSFQFYTPTALSVPGVGTVYSASNPSLAVYGTYAYISWTDSSGNNYVSESQDMSNWSAPLTVPATPTVTSMDMVAQPNSGYLWIAYMQGPASSSSYSPIICSIIPNSVDFPTSSTSCNTVTYMSTVNFNPSLTWDQNNNLYAFMEYRGNSHCLNSYVNPNGGQSGSWEYYNPSDLCHDQQTSSAPSSIFYFDGLLYVGYRSNDSTVKFDYVAINTSTNTWTHVSLADQMDGGPDLLEVSTADGISLLQPQEMINFFALGGYLNTMYGY